MTTKYEIIATTAVVKTKTQLYIEGELRKEIAASATAKLEDLEILRNHLGELLPTFFHAYGGAMGIDDKFLTCKYECIWKHLLAASSALCDAIEVICKNETETKGT